MPDEKSYISKITLPTGNTYYIKDERVDSLMNATHWIGVTTTALTDGATTNPITIDGNSVTAVAGDITSYDNEEFIFNGTTWQEFGSTGALKAFAFADTGSVTIQPKGSNASSAVTFAGGTSDSVLGEDTTFTNSTSAVSFSGGSTETFLKSDVTATVPKTSSTKKYLTASASGAALSTSGDTIKPVTNVGTAASWSASVSNENLTFSWTPDTVPTLGSDKTFLTSASVGTQPTVTLTAADSTSTGAVDYISDVSTSGTDDVTFATTGHTASAITSIGTATAAAQTITVGTNDKVTAVTDIGTGTAAAQTFTGTSESYTVNPNT